MLGRHPQSSRADAQGYASGLETLSVRVLERCLLCRGFTCAASKLLAGDQRRQPIHYSHICSRLRSASHFLRKMMIARQFLMRKGCFFWILRVILEDFLTFWFWLQKSVFRSIAFMISGPGSRSLRSASHFLRKMMIARQFLMRKGWFFFGF
jgi:hypothetical protein